MKRISREIVRRVLFSRENEKIDDTLTRHKYNVLKRLSNKKYTKYDLEAEFQNIGIERGDCLMVHSSWRAFSGFEGTPDDVIDILERLVGREGTILMPANDKPKQQSFDVVKSPNFSGVLSRCFTLKPEVNRSAGGHFSVAGKGALANDILKDHYKSEYGFDNLSPYGKFATSPQAKVVFLAADFKAVSWLNQCCIASRAAGEIKSREILLSIKVCLRVTRN